MNYKGILTEEIAEQLRNEKATFVIISIFNEKDLIRDIEVKLRDTTQIFSVAGKTTAGQAACAKNYLGEIHDGVVWYPFQSTYFIHDCNPDKTLKIIAEHAKCEVTDLQWSFIIEH